MTDKVLVSRPGFTTLLTLALLLATALGGCGNAPYYAQAARGQVGLWRQAQPIEAVLEDPKTPASLRERLAFAVAVRNFASKELALPDNGSYRNYADIQRPCVVWNVYATPELSVKPKEWCFPVAGCVGYRGYFSEREAEAFAQRLRDAGYDVYVAGVPAYSTLGWFDDPILSSFVYYRDEDLASLIFHELAHQLLYVRGDTVFNESFATAVELEGVTRWLRRSKPPEEAAAFEVSRKRRQEFRDLVLMHRDRLDSLFASAADDDEKRSGKAKIFAELRQDYEGIKSAWGGYGGYDGWFSKPVNNARLASMNAYGQLVPAFRALLNRLDGDLDRFYAAVKSVSTLPKEERETALSSPLWPQSATAARALGAQPEGG